MTGLDARPSNLTCLAPSRTGGAADIALTTAFGSLGFSDPHVLLQSPGDNQSWYVAERDGRIRVFEQVSGTWTFRPNPFIQIAVNASTEGGLLGIMAQVRP